MNKDDLRAILLRAWHSPYGLLIRASDPRRFRVLFYPLRKELGLFGLSIRLVDASDGNVQIERAGQSPTERTHD